MDRLEQLRHAEDGVGVGVGMGIEEVAGFASFGLGAEADGSHRSWILYMLLQLTADCISGTLLCILILLVSLVRLRYLVRLTDLVSLLKLIVIGGRHVLVDLRSFRLKILGNDLYVLKDLLEIRNLVRLDLAQSACELFDLGVQVSFSLVLELTTFGLELDEWDLQTLGILLHLTDLILIGIDQFGSARHITQKDD